MRILLVEDNLQLAEQLTDALSEQHYVIDVAADGWEGWELAHSASYDLILLDVMLPKLDGVSLCRRIREHGYKVPVMLMTARGTNEDKVLGLDSGADDYVVKPVRLDELNARIRALLRRGSTTIAPILTWGSLRLDPSNCEVTYDHCLLHLTPKEYALLELFMRNQQRVFSRSAILEQLWSFDSDPPGEETVKAHVKGLRQKLKAFGAADLIETVYGLGYRLNTAFAKPTPSSTSASDEQKQSLKEPNIAQVWELCKDRFLARVSAIETTIKALQQGTLTLELQQQARQEAHKLLGTLGTFGVHEGSQIAQKIEILLLPDGTLTTDQVETLVEYVAALRQTIEAVVPQALAQPKKSSNPLQSNEDRSTPQPLLLIVDDDTELVSLLQSEATVWGLQTAIATTPQQARMLLKRIQPNVMLLDLSFTDTQDDGLTLLAELSNQPSSPPVLVFTGSHQVADRIAVAHYRAKGFLQKPTTPTDVLSAVTQVLQQHAQTTAPRILVMDDHLSNLEQIRSILEPWGLQITILQTIQQFWEVLEAVTPDLLIVNLDMQEVNDFEFCQMLRNDSRWRWLPILCLTAIQEADTLNQVFGSGADDIVHYPLDAQTLLTRTLNRLERSQTLRNQMTTDLLTGLDTWQRSTQELSKFLQLAKHAQQSLCLAVLTIDHLQQINQQYGYDMGDRLLRRFAKFLRQELRREDVIARRGGAEFVIGMYGMTRRDGVEWLAGLLEMLRQIQLGEIVNGDSQFTFSAGVAQYPTDGETLPMLSKAASKALSQAKIAGGDRVLPADWQSIPSIRNTIFLVHPDARLAQEMLRALQTRGYHGQWIPDGQTAIAQFTEGISALRGQIIFLAEELSNMDGLTVLQHLVKHKVTQYSRIIFLATQTHAQAAIELGAFDYVVTPCSVAVLMQRLHRALRIDE